VYYKPKGFGCRNLENDEIKVWLANTIVIGILIGILAKADPWAPNQVLRASGL